MKEKELQLKQLAIDIQSMELEILDKFPDASEEIKQAFKDAIFIAYKKGQKLGYRKALSKCLRKQMKKKLERKMAKIS